MEYKQPTTKEPTVSHVTGVAVSKAALQDAVQEAAYSPERAERFLVASKVTVTDELFADIAEDPWAYRDLFIKYNAKVAAKALRELHVLKISTKSGKVAYVDTQGYDYARYFVVPV